MHKVKIKTRLKQILADTITPVSVYLRVRDVFPQSVLLENSDYHTSEDSYSFICLRPFASFTVDRGKIIIQNEDGSSSEKEIMPGTTVPEEMNRFFRSFEIENPDPRIRTNGFFGYSAWDSVKYFEDIEIAGIHINKGLWLEHMFIDPKNIGDGIGKKLFNHMKEHCMIKDIRKIGILADPNSKGFYEKMGCIYRGEYPSTIEGRTTPFLECIF